MQWECNVSKVSAAVRVQYFPLTLYFPLLLLPYPLLRNGLLNISVMHLLLTFMSFMATGYCTRPCTLSSPSLCNIHWIQNIYTNCFWQIYAARVDLEIFGTLHICCEACCEGNTNDISSILSTFLVYIQTSKSRSRSHHEHEFRVRTEID